MDLAALVRHKLAEWRIDRYFEGQIIFPEGNPAHAIFYILNGNVKLGVMDEKGREAIIALLTKDEFFGEECLDHNQVRTATATALTDCDIARIDKAKFVAIVHHTPGFCELFIAHVLERTERIQADLVDQLFNPTEKRLARALLLLANVGKEGEPQALMGKLSQTLLAELVGTTRSRVSFFMNKFRKLGLIEYDRRGNVEVHKSLLNRVLHERPHIR